jgi:hypothetical protein
MVDDKAYLVVMMVYLDSPLVIQNILKVLEVLTVLMVLNFLLLDLMAIQQKSSTFLGISVCIFIRFIALGVYDLDLIPTWVVLLKIELEWL